MTEDHLRDEDLLCGVLLNRNAIAVILYTDEEAGRTSNGTHLNVFDRSLTGFTTTNKCIPRIHNNLIKELVESRIESAVAIDHLSLLSVKDPSHLIVCLYRTNIGIRQLKNMLSVRVFLISISCRHFVILRVGVMVPSNLNPSLL
jgi:hypothetical protein